MKAILYESNTGYTQKYAELLSEKTGLPAYPRSEAAKNLEVGDAIIYMGWICAGSVKGFEKTNKTYNIRALCPVGMGAPNDKVVQDLIAKHHLVGTKVFYLQGGFDMDKLHGVYHFMMKTMAKTLGKTLEKKADKTPDEQQMLDMVEHGGDCVSVENLAPLLDWYRSESAS